MAMQNASEGHQVKFGDPAPRAGSIGMVLLVALVLVGAAVGLLVIGRTHADNYILSLLAGLAVVGVFSLFAGAAGILRLAGAENRDSTGDAVA